MLKKSPKNLIFRTMAGKISCDGTPFLMGILNVTPDSFYDGGALLTEKGRLNSRHLLAKAEAMILAGARILDIGGESTRPGFQPISAKEEMGRVIPAIKALRKAFPQQLLSLDTVKPEVADAGLKEGVDILNELGGLKNPEMCQLVAKYQPGVILTSVTNSPLTELKKLLQHACRETRLSEEYFILDPGIGFGKLKASDATNGNRKAILAMPRIRVKLKRPILLSHSRKSYIDQLLERASAPQQRLGATLATSLLAVTQFQADGLRIHDVAETADALRIYRILTTSPRIPSRKKP